MSEKFTVKTADLKCICDPKQFKFKNTAQVAPLETVIGQERAVRAIEFGLNMKSPGYNIFVTGIEVDFWGCCEKADGVVPAGCRSY